MKKILIGLIVLLIAVFALKSCLSSESACGSNEKDVLKQSCEKLLNKN
jgi:uncharacterized alpha/beta hydrolase family protein